MTSWTVVPKGTLENIATRYALGLKAISISFPENFASGEIQLKDCEVITENSLKGVRIKVTMWNQKGMLVHIGQGIKIDSLPNNSNNPFLSVWDGKI